MRWVLFSKNIPITFYIWIIGKSVENFEQSKFIGSLIKSRNFVCILINSLLEELKSSFYVFIKSFKSYKCLYFMKVSKYNYILY